MKSWIFTAMTSASMVWTCYALERSMDMLCIGEKYGHVMHWREVWTCYALERSMDMFNKESAIYRNKETWEIIDEEEMYNENVVACTKCNCIFQKISGWKYHYNISHVPNECIKQNGNFLIQ